MEPWCAVKHALETVYLNLEDHDGRVSSYLLTTNTVPACMLRHLLQVLQKNMQILFNRSLNKCNKLL